MVWNEHGRESVTQASVVDIHFKLCATTLAAEHRYALFRALAEHLPWLLEVGAGISPIQPRFSGNGWQRDSAVSDEVLHIAKRTRLHLRVPRARVNEVLALQDRSLLIDEHSLTLKTGNVRELLPEGTLYARSIVAMDADEQAFQERVVASIKAQNIDVNRVMCGLYGSMPVDSTVIPTRAFMITDLTPAESLRLQTQGVGDLRHLGCGLFVPHKSVAAVR
jgi:CRISPR-associated protein Cas6